MKLSKIKHNELANKVEYEGFWYYMTEYGPDLKSISKLGFSKDDVEDAIELLSRVEMAIIEGLDEDLYE